MFESPDYVTAFALTLFAGLSTGIGSAVAFFAPRTNYRFLGLAMGFSAGVMLYVSFTEILGKANASVNAVHGAQAGPWIVLAAFFGGIALAGIIDAMVPKAGNPHQPRDTGALNTVKEPEADAAAIATLAPDRPLLLRTGTFAALAIALHNFPEGLATFLMALEDPKLGTALAVAVALHNIPEGVSVSVPIYYATGSRRRAFIYSLLSGLAEPIGAVAGYLLLRLFFTDDIMGVLFGMVAGIMVYISLDEMLPAAHMYGTEHDALFGVVSGMGVMAVSLALIT
jgi:zinc transporter, ZIP family